VEESVNSKHQAGVFGAKAICIADELLLCNGRYSKFNSCRHFDFNDPPRRPEFGPYRLCPV